MGPCISKVINAGPVGSKEQLLRLYVLVFEVKFVSAKLVQLCLCLDLLDDLLTWSIVAVDRIIVDHTDI